MQLMKIRTTFVMKSGAKFIVYCENAKITTSAGVLQSYSLDGIKGDKPLYIRVDEIDTVLTKKIFAWCK